MSAAGVIGLVVAAVALAAGVSAAVVAFAASRGRRPEVGDDTDEPTSAGGSIS